MENPHPQIRDETISQIETWAASHPSPQEKVSLNGGVYTKTPTQILRDVQNKTTFGKWYASQWQQDEQFRKELDYNKTKKFLGIGTSHNEHDSVLFELEKFKPSALTLENYTTSIFEGNVTRPRLIQMSNKCNLVFGDHPFEAYFTLSQKKYNFAATPDMVAAIEYSTKNNIPFYFINWNPVFPDSFIEFNNPTKVTKIAHPIYLDYPSEYSTEDGHSIICMNEVNARNRFMAEVINSLFQGYDSIAHVGGQSHFNSEDSGSVLGIPFILSKDCELQNLVSADNKILIDVSPKSF